MNLIDPTLIYLKASFATTAKTYQSLPSEFIFFSSFSLIKPGFCAKISSQISDPQKTTVQYSVTKLATTADWQKISKERTNQPLRKTESIK